MTTPLSALKSAITDHCGSRVPRGELWLGSELFREENLADTIDTHFRLADRLNHDLICLPVSSDAVDTKPDLGYRYFGDRDIKQAVTYYDLPVFAVIDGPFQELVNEMGLMAVLSNWIQNKNKMAAAYKKQSDKIMGLIFQMLEHAVSAIVITDDFACDSGPMVNPSDIETLFGLFYNKAVHTINKAGAAVFLHSCGNLTPLIPTIKTWQINGFSAIQNTVNDLSSLYQEFDASIMIMAGIESELLDMNPPPAATLKRFEDTIKTLAGTGNLILSTSCGLYKAQHILPLERFYAAADRYRE